MTSPPHARAEPHPTVEELEARLEHIRAAPADDGVLELIVRRPDIDAREVLAEAELDVDDGLVGDRWSRSRSRDRGRQLTLIMSRVVDAVAGDRDRWHLAGDQLYVDLDLGVGNLLAGTRLRIGDAVLKVTNLPHLGCRKFSARYGPDALRFVNDRERRHLRLRGCHASVLEAGIIRTGDPVQVVRD